jgi:DNA topoisomerase-1
MAKNLVIVESPAKAKTIKKYLGGGYDVIASVGHVRDLPLKRIGVDVKNNFEPKYSILKGKEKIVNELKEKAAKSKKIFLATDPDREGEAISWHIANILGLESDDENRVAFNEITKKGVGEGIKKPRRIDMDLVNAQQARRILDRLVGYKLSPYLCQKIHKGLSAGRVQSVALRIIIDREKEIHAFVPREFWTIEVDLTAKGSGNRVFRAKFWGKEEKEIRIKNSHEANEIIEALNDACYIVKEVKTGKRNKNPSPPFITSTLQQEAVRKLSFTARRTMKVAQELYEGVEIPELGTTGLITYMRTDSLRISESAAKERDDFILTKWGKNYLPAKPRFFKNKKSAQDAHEAIRPTHPTLEPEKLRFSLTLDQFKVYKLIWDRFTASGMANCVQDIVKVKIDANGYEFRASGCCVDFDGFTILYTEGFDKKEEDEKMLPSLENGTVCKLKKLVSDRHFTEPPPRFTEASLIKTLEENGIGRPSTYALAISTIVYREYVAKEGKVFVPTELGDVVNSILMEYFGAIVDIKFTAEMETALDKVEEGNTEWTDLLSVFYGDFERNLEEIKEKTKDLKIKLKEDETDIICDKCGLPMEVKYGRFGRFIGCSGYPECSNIKKYVKKIGVECPKCGAQIIKKSSKKGRCFFGCEKYPECDFVSWSMPTNEKCPNCGKMLFKTNKKIFCEEKICKYSRNI